MQFKQNTDRVSAIVLKLFYEWRNEKQDVIVTINIRENIGWLEKHCPEQKLVYSYKSQSEVPSSRDSNQCDVLGVVC